MDGAERVRRWVGPGQAGLCSHREEVGPILEAVGAGDDVRLAQRNCFQTTPVAIVWDQRGGRDQELMQKFIKILVAEVITPSKHPPWPSSVLRTKSKLRLALHFLILFFTLLFYNLWAQPG